MSVCVYMYTYILHLFTHALNKYLSTYCVPGTGTEKTTVTNR